MEELLLELIQHYERNLDKYFPKDHLGIADRFLFNRTIPEVSHRSTGVLDNKGAIFGQTNQVEREMQRYGLYCNLIKFR